MHAVSKLGVLDTNLNLRALRAVGDEPVDEEAINGELLDKR
jgi:hypothetical protein